MSDPTDSDPTDSNPGDSNPGDSHPADGDPADYVARLADDGVDGGALVGLAKVLSRSMAGVGPKAIGSGRWLVDQVLEIAPRVPIRDLATLIEHHGGLRGDLLADTLVKQASRSTAAVGAIGGGITSVEIFVPPTLLAVPVQIAAETLAVIAIELKLLAELQEVYHQSVEGGAVQRGGQLVQAWSQRRGVKASMLSIPGVRAALGDAARKQLTKRVLQRLARSSTTVVPFLVGAAAGAELNRRATVALGESVAKDLRRTQPATIDVEVVRPMSLPPPPLPPPPP